MANWSTTTKHEPSSINNGRRYELRDRVSIEQLNNMTENSFYAMDKARDAIQKAEEALSFAQGSGTTVYENGQPVSTFNADKKADKTDLDDYYTKEQVDDLISSGGEVDVDLSNYYTKDETYSKQEVDNAISNVEVDLSSYYNKTETDDLLNQKANKSDLTNYVTTETLENKNYATISQLNSGLNEKANQTSLDTTNSNVALLQTSISALETDNATNKTNITDLQNNKADKSEIPDVSSFITKAVSDLENYYTKSETYTQAEVNSLVSTIPKFSIVVTPALPTTNISETTIYLLLAGDESSNLYNEYIYVNGDWERLGSQWLDLSGYVTEEELEAKGYLTSLPNNVAKTDSDNNFSTNQTIAGNIYLSKSNSSINGLLNQEGSDFATTAPFIQVDNTNGAIVIGSEYVSKVTSPNIIQAQGLTDGTTSKTMTEILQGGGGVTILKGAMCRKLSQDKEIGSGSFIDYDMEMCSIGSGLTYSNGNFIVGNGITAIKFNFSHAFYNMTKVGYLQTQIYKNGVAVPFTQLWTFFDSGLSGAGGGTLLLPASSGDVFSVWQDVSSGSGYLNNNSFVEVEVF